MVKRSSVSRRVGALVVGLCLLPGCGGGTVDNGVAEEPNIGPGGPPGAPKGESPASATAPGASKGKGTPTAVK